MKHLTLGLLVNPVAGIGGAVGLKGSDGADIQAEAARRGAVPRATERVRLFLQALAPASAQIAWVTGAGAMGADALRAENLPVAEVIDVSSPTTAADTRAVAQAIQARGIDLLVFAGGDGTARDLVAARADDHSVWAPVLGIPAGVKIHSGVYAVHARGAAEIVSRLVSGEPVAVIQGEVRDIDEAAFRQNQVKTRHYGELPVPGGDRYLQHVKCTGRLQEPLQLDDIADYVIAEMKSDQLYVLGPGTTTRAIAERMGVASTLLGVDIVLNSELVATDVGEVELLNWCQRYRANLVLTPIGGQGHLIGRGNHQFSPAVLKAVGKPALVVVATSTKLAELEQRPLLLDSWDAELNRAWAGLVPVITGYEQTVLYPLEG